MQGHLQTLLNIPLAVLNGGIVNDIMMIFTGLINIALILLAFRLIYSIIKGESFVPEGIINKWRENQESEEYDEIYKQELHNFRVSNLRNKARNEIRNSEK